MTDQRGDVREPAAPAPRTADGASRSTASPGPGHAATALARSPDPLRDLAERLRRSTGADVLVLLRPRDADWDVLETAPSGAPGAGSRIAPQLSAALPGPRDAPEAGVVAVGAGIEDTPLARLLAPAGLEALVQVPLRVADELWGLLCLGRAQPTGPAELTRAQAEATAATELLVLAERLRASERRADTDPLTGLANRRAFDEWAQAAFDEHLLTGAAVGVVMCDLNGLKQVNDRAGHDAGDQLLVAVGQVLARAAAPVPGVVTARLGGDEFGLLLVGVPDEQVVGLALECCRQVEELPEGAGLSCGVATTSGVLEPVADVHHLLRLADGAQYRAKRLAARGPVVAGRPLDPGAGRRPAEAPGAAAAPRARRRHDLARVLSAGVERLAAAEHESTLQRLVQVGAVVQEHLDASAWEVGHVPPGSAAATTVAAGRGGAAPGSARLSAGAGGSGGSWLLEVHLDELGDPPAGLDAVLRALVALAVRPA